MDYVLEVRSILEMTFGGTSVPIRPLFYALLIIGIALSLILIFKDKFSNVTFFMAILNAAANTIGAFMKNSLAEGFTNGEYNNIVQSVDGVCLLVSAITTLHLLVQLRKDLKSPQCQEAKEETKTKIKP